MSDELRAEIHTAIDDPGYFVDHDLLGFNSLEHQTDAVMDVVKRRIARERMAIEAQIADHVAMREQAARAETAEQIAAAIEHVPGQAAYRARAARIARQHGEEVGSDV